jgi:hypothetical protein
MKETVTAAFELRVRGIGKSRVVFLQDLCVLQLCRSVEAHVFRLSDLGRIRVVAD